MCSLMTKGRTNLIPDDAFCVLGVTLEDLYVGDDDNFTAGLASIANRVGVFSFCSYVNPPREVDETSEDEDCEPPAKRVKKAKLPFRTISTVPDDLLPTHLLFHASKTAVHEIAHLFGLGHCVLRHCLMNGSGHMKEDMSIPHHACPVCLAKLLVVIRKVTGIAVDVTEWYKGMGQFYAKTKGFESEALWVRNVLMQLDSGARS